MDYTEESGMTKFIYLELPWVLVVIALLVILFMAKYILWKEKDTYTELRFRDLEFSSEGDVQVSRNEEVVMTAL